MTSLLESRIVHQGTQRTCIGTVDMRSKQLYWSFVMINSKREDRVSTDSLTVCTD